MRYFSRIIVVACTAFCAVAQAQSVTKPGLWEISNKMSSPTNPQLAQQMEAAQKAMAAMPPEQRKQMEEMMAQKGLGIRFGDNGAMLLKMCITPEMAKANRPPVQQQANCTYQFSQSGSTHNISYQCTNPSGDGQGQLVFADAENYTGKMRINTTTKDGKKETIDALTQGKFLGANCGEIKPLPAAAK
jgi:Protein of unknown function (DUF3617)